MNMTDVKCLDDLTFIPKPLTQPCQDDVQTIERVQTVTVIDAYLELCLKEKGKTMTEHTLYRPCDLDAGRYAEFVQDARLLCLRLEDQRGDTQGPEKLLLGPSGQDAPILDAETIHFRIGTCEFRSQRSDRTSFERLHLETNPWRWHVFTILSAQRWSLYERLVGALLIAFKDHFPETILDSDASSSEWWPAVQLFQRCFPARQLLPGPWSKDAVRLHIDEVALLDSQAQRVGYRVVHEKDLLVLVFGRDYRDREGKNVPFVNDARGKRELASYLRHLTDVQPIIDDQSRDWKWWSEMAGIPARWTKQVYEFWLLDKNGVLDLRKLEANDASTSVWVPRRALSMFIESPGDLQRYRFVLLDKGGVQAVRIEKRWNGYGEPRNPRKLEFFPVAVLKAVIVTDE